MSFNYTMQSTDGNTTVREMHMSLWWPLGIYGHLMYLGAFAAGVVWYVTSKRKSALRDSPLWTIFYASIWGTIYAIGISFVCELFPAPLKLIPMMGIAYSVKSSYDRWH